MNKKVENLIFYSGEVDIRKGGPAGYIANLREGLKSISDTSTEVLCSVKSRKEKPAKFFAHFLTFWIPVKKIRKLWREKIFRYLFVSMGGSYPVTEEYPVLCPAFCRQLDTFDFKTITCHCVLDFLAVYNYLKKRGSKTQICLMSHTPEAPSSEVFNHLIACGVERKSAEETRKRWEQWEREALKKADVLIFPSAEAMEPYYQTMPDFADCIENKRICFVATGAKALNIALSRDDARKKWGVETPKTICYLGRHNSVKGYDILRDCAADILAQRDDVTFLIGGKQGYEFSPLEHKRWKELGWVNPADVLAAADVFVLPNRRTYFDLVLLEVLSAGVPVIASDTGGNKTVSKLTGKIMLFEDAADLKSRIEAFLDGQIHFDQKEIIDAYQKHFSLPVFAAGYRAMIQDIIENVSGEENAAC